MSGCALIGGTGAVNAAEYFNPALLEIDNPVQGNADLSIFEDGDLQAPAPTVLIFISMVQLLILATLNSRWPLTLPVSKAFSRV